MKERYSRTARLLGDEAVAALRRKHVAVFGLGGVGGYAVEALARSGVGTLTLVDSDTLAPSNLNRQLLATTDTLGQDKAAVAAARVAAIDPGITVLPRRCFFLPDTADTFDFTAYDYIIDAIDTVSGKLALAEYAYRAGTPLIAAMGAGNKLDPTALRVADIFETSVCPLARVMRQELKKRQIPALKVVYSTEPPKTPPETGEAFHKASPGSVVFVPAAMGLTLASAAVQDLLTKEGLL